MKISVEQAAEILKTNKAVAIPTETVYGLAANALSDQAILEIYTLKNRPSTNPLIIHVKNIEHANEFAHLNEYSKLLATNFWPGPLTFVVKSKNKISKLASARLDTIAIRSPYNPQFQEVLDLIDFPLAAPSANISNQISPTSSLEVSEYFPNLPVIDGGRTSLGIESTIIDLTDDIPKILRHGSITKEKISEVLNCDILENASSEIKAPGMMKKHYAPNCELLINQTESSDEYYSINFADSKLISKFQTNLSVDGILELAAKNLFRSLKMGEKIVKQENLKGIKVAVIPNISVGLAINDKLNRASTK